MTQPLPTPAPQEIELKLSLPTADPAGLRQRLTQVPLLARYKPQTLTLYNQYFDTPDQALRRQRCALRIRRVGQGEQTQWLQTLKNGASDASALSQRGEWESPVSGPQLSSDALANTAWPEMDPSGALFASLQPCFVTQFERTIWMVRRSNGSCVEVALDLGSIEAGGHSAAICELELELKAGTPDDVFAVAHSVAASVAVLPANQSKAQRGFLLAQGDLLAPIRARAPRLVPELGAHAMAQAVLREMFGQFTTNVVGLMSSDDPELVHQARVGWRRFRSLLRLLKPLGMFNAVASWQDMLPLLARLGDVRNLDVAATQTLPRLREAYALADDQRANAWLQMTQAVTDAANVQRQACRALLQQPAVGATMLALTQWLEALTAAPPKHPTKEAEQLRHWAKARIERLHRRLERAQRQAAHDLDQQHRVRILAKRLRYGVESLSDLLPKKQVRFCHAYASSLQADLGDIRDLALAGELMAQLGLEVSVVEFVRGVVVGAAMKSA